MDDISHFGQEFYCLIYKVKLPLHNINKFCLNYETLLLYLNKRQKKQTKIAFDITHCLWYNVTDIRED